MLDINLIREDPEMVRKNLEKRKDPEIIERLDQLIQIDNDWRETVHQLNKLRKRRNDVTQEIAKAKKEGKDIRKLIKETQELPDKIDKLEKKEKDIKKGRKKILLRIPNLLHESVPYGKGDQDNVVINKWGGIPKFDFKPKNHQEILENLGLLESEKAAEVSGMGFFYEKEELALLDHALQKFAIDYLRKRGYKLIIPPYMIRRKPYEGVTDLGDFEDVMYKIKDEDMYLIATSEHPIAAMKMNEVINEGDLPLKFCGLSPCFRKEVGSHGKYTKGLFRMHQFHKVEQFIFSHPDESWRLHKELQKNSDSILKILGVAHRVTNVCTGDIGIIAAKKYDTEIWMADGEYREVGSNSNCTDYQARRLNVKFREGSGKPIKGFIHTLNNTAIATSRVMIAIIEQNQQEDGSVIIPKVLRGYMGGIEKLEKKS
ncbi:MAG: serine--tRNA ligase [Candidatus Aenigmarchaeota archaeon]|nr:serine--tRNA ligase [Candidatus Aenigmarchaeota archaeon]